MKKIVIFLSLFALLSIGVMAQTLVKNQETGEYTMIKSVVIDTQSLKTTMNKSFYWLNITNKVKNMNVGDSIITCQYIFKPNRNYGFFMLKIGFDMSVGIVKSEYGNQPHQTIELKFNNFYYESDYEIVKFNSKYFDKYDKKLRDLLITETNTELDNLTNKLSLTYSNDKTGISIDYAQRMNNADKVNLYESKIESYNQMKTTGTGLVVFGLALGGVGTYLYSDGLKGMENGSINDLSDNASKATIGAYMMVGGLTSLIAGAVLNTVGYRKSNEYQHKLDRLNISGYIVPESKGFYLSYKF